MKVLIINGPNLNNIGIREPEIYGNISFSEYLGKLQLANPSDLIEYFHSSLEGEIVAKMHNAQSNFDGIILNAGAYSHTSVCIRDAVAAINIPVVMVHISNVYQREKFRHQNIIAPVCKGIITGFGLNSYKLALYSLNSDN
jgi:3-dehydroquinate dehydratase II